MALGGRRFKCLNNNQMGDSDDVRGCVGEEARLGRNVWGGRLPVVWGVELIDKTNRERKLSSKVRGALERRRDWGGTCGGHCPIVWGVEWSGKK